MIVNNFQPIELSTARNQINEINVKIQIEEVYFNNALGRNIAFDLISQVNVPEFNKSPLDGYAFQKSDVVNASKDNPVRLKVVDTIMAGNISNKTILHGQAARIMTGAKIPEGADCVVGYENTDFTDEYVDIFAPIGKKSNIILKGEDIREKEIIISKGSLITPAEIGVFASLGMEKVRVFKRPIVTVFAIGSELIEVGEKSKDGKIRNSNSYTIEQLAKTCGAEVIQKGIVPDNLEELVNAYRDALKVSDIVVSTGGISVGDEDYVLTAMDKIGVNAVFTRVSTKPGGHIFAGYYNDKLVFGLSGNPAAAFINFYLYVKPLIKKMQGVDFKPNRIETTLLNDFSKTAKVPRIIRANTFYKDGIYYSELSNKQGSGVLSSMVGKNSLIIIPPNEKLQKDSKVYAEMLYE